MKLVQRVTRLFALATLALLACGDSDESSDGAEPLAGDTACEKWTALAEAKGCAAPSECVLVAACDARASAWLDCAARDLSQCLCESGDGDLNCEGSWKPDEGPALCVPEFTAFQACQGPDDAAAHVGLACLPEQVPETGFDGQEAYLEGDNADCDGDACLVYRLAGDPRPDCTPSPQVPCATPEEVQARVHCTCRCDAPDGEAGCECPDGFACVQVLDQGPPDIVGSYCVRNR